MSKAPKRTHAPSHSNNVTDKAVEITKRASLTRERKLLEAEARNQLFLEGLEKKVCDLQQRILDYSNERMAAPAGQKGICDGK